MKTTLSKKQMAEKIFQKMEKNPKFAEKVLMMLEKKKKALNSKKSTNK